jgi:hypothetical protein
MKVKGFLGGTDQQRSTNLAENKLINLYPTTNDDGTVGAFITTPGLSLYGTIPSGAVTSGIYTTSTGRCFTVAGNTLYEITTGAVFTSRGTITSAEVSVMKDNGLELIIVNGIDGWILKLDTNVLTKIASADFPNGTKTVDFINGRFACCVPNSADFQYSEVAGITVDAGTQWSILNNLSSADSNPDYAVGLVNSHNELIVFCENSGEAFRDTGASPEPYVRNQSSVFEVGCKAPHSIAKIDNSVMWLGNSDEGLGVIWRMDGYTPVRKSSYSVEYAIQSMTDTSDAIAFTYQQDGHHFYVITFPTGNKTFAYDVNTGLWHERASFSEITGAFSRWEAHDYAYFDGKHLVCDYVEGKIYSLQMGVYQDNGAIRKWVRSFRAPSTDMKRVVHNKLTLEIESGVGLVGGVDPQIMLRYSNDGGHNWSSELWRSMGKVGEFAKRVVWWSLGMTSGQPRIYEVSGTESVRTVLLAAYIE